MKIHNLNFHAKNARNTQDFKKSHDEIKCDKLNFRAKNQHLEIKSAVASKPFLARKFKCKKRRKNIKNTIFCTLFENYLKCRI